jgi:hypothetical protein
MCMYVSKDISLDHAGAKGKRKCSSYSFSTPALDGDERSESRPASL